MTDLRDRIDSIVTTKIATAILPAVFTTGHERLAREATDEIIGALSPVREALDWMEERSRNSLSYGSHADAYEIAARKLREALGLKPLEPLQPNGGGDA